MLSLSLFFFFFIQPIYIMLVATANPYKKILPSRGLFARALSTGWGLLGVLGTPRCGRGISAYKSLLSTPAGQGLA